MYKVVLVFLIISFKPLFLSDSKLALILNSFNPKADEILLFKLSNIKLFKLPSKTFPTRLEDLNLLKSSKLLELLNARSPNISSTGLPNS